MGVLLHELITRQAKLTPAHAALSYRGQTLSYAELQQLQLQIASSLRSLNIKPNDRIAVYLPKQIETVVSFFASTQAGGVFVPLNPLLKTEQVQYILRDCNVRVLITSSDRAALLENVFNQLDDLHAIVLTDDNELRAKPPAHIEILRWSWMLRQSGSPALPWRIDTDLASILYTSGSTGKPKGVVLSHRNMVTGAESVSSYLQNTNADRLLAVLPFSFDYGLSQLTIAFNVGACTVLMDYLFPRDVVNTVAKERITGLAAVPPLWAQIAHLPWPQEAVSNLRYITNSGGAMPLKVLQALRAALPNTEVFLMYGLTEAFRSSYLPPSQLDIRPTSMGKAIPNAELLVVREDGSPCEPNEPGELVHRGSLVSLGYWNDPARTAERFRPAPQLSDALPLKEIAVWSGDTVRMDEEGYLYFIGRKDDMIKTSGYRVSPTEVEEVLYTSALVEHAAAIGVPHQTLGQAIVAVVTPLNGESDIDRDALLKHCKQHLPAFMVPERFAVKSAMPRNPNGKIDRKLLSVEWQNTFQEDAS